MKQFLFGERITSFPKFLRSMHSFKHTFFYGSTIDMRLYRARAQCMSNVHCSSNKQLKFNDFYNPFRKVPTRSIFFLFQKNASEKSYCTVHTAFSPKSQRENVAGGLRAIDFSLFKPKYEREYFH